MKRVKNVLYARPDEWRLVLMAVPAEMTGDHGQLIPTNSLKSFCAFAASGQNAPDCDVAIGGLKKAEVDLILETANQIEDEAA